MTLRGGMIDKKAEKSDVLGQSLGGMDKVAAEMARHVIQTASIQYLKL